MSILKIKFKELAQRREKRIPGFMFKYVYAELWKVIIRLILFKENRLYTFSSGTKLFLNIDANTIKIVERIYQVKKQDVYYWNKVERNMYNFISIYFPFILRWQIKKFDEIIFSTDISLANYNTLKMSPGHTKKVCMQHGYFPLQNTKDLDGLNSDHYIVRSDSQAKLLTVAGYSGTVEVKSFNQQRINSDSTPSILVFVGPGFGHNKSYEEIIFEIMTVLGKSEKKYQLFYRPHPRCSNWLKNQMESINVKIDRTGKTELNADCKKFFVGVKSTMLIDAQEIGHSVLLIVDDRLPEYFAKGDIKNVTDIGSLQAKLG